MGCASRPVGAENETDAVPWLARNAGVATTCAAAGAARTSAIVLQAEMASDDHPLHLIRALADLENLLIAVQAGDGGFLHVPESAVDLQRRVRSPVRELARVELRHRRLACERAPAVLQPGGLVHERAPRLDLGGHVRELEADRLERGDLLSELLALPRVREGEVVGALSEPDAHRRDGD